MFGSRKIVLYVLIAFAILSPFIFFSSPLKPWETATWFPTYLQEPVFPLVRAWHGTAGFTRHVWNTYFDLSHAARENQDLKQQLTMLKTQLSDYEEQVQQISRLRKLLGFTERYKGQLLVAEVIGGKTSEPFKSLRIARGTHQGIRVGMPVVTAEGVVGRIIRSSISLADVQLLVDFDFNLDVLLQRTRVRGVLAGHAGENCRLNLQKGTEVRIGDTVVTSGLVGGFPKGLPVGRVMRIAYESDNVTQVITVEPWVDYRRLEEVIVLYEMDPELQKIFESAGKEWLDENTRGFAGG